MTHSPDGSDAREPFDGRSAITTFVDRLQRRVGQSPSFTGAPPSFSGTVDHAGPDEVEAFCEAGRRAIDRYPGPVGEFVAQELETAAGFGFRFGTDTLLMQLVDHLLDAEMSARSTSDTSTAGC